MYFKATTWNPSDKMGNVILSNGNLTALATAAGGYNGVRSTVGVSSGKWYWEVVYDIVGIGGHTLCSCVATLAAVLNVYPYTDPYTRTYYAANGFKSCDAEGQVVYGSSYTVGDTIGVALDMDAGKLWWAKNGVWQNSGDPVAGTNPACDNLVGIFYAMWSEYRYNGQATANFGVSPFSYTVPTGFTAGLGEYFEESDGYTGEVYFHNTDLETRTNYPVKLILTEDNFNFDLTQSNGFDFRLTERANGSGVLKMWIAGWDKDNKYAVLWFKIPQLSSDPESVFYAFWGGDYSDDISMPEELGFLFYEDFEVTPLDSDKWAGIINSNTTIYGYLFPSASSFTTITNPLTGQNSWAVEAGVYLVNDTSCDLNDRTHGFEFMGDENGFVINMMHNTRVEHNAINPGGSTYSNIDKTHGGLEFNSYQEHYIAYYEPEDRIYQRIVNRKSYVDIENKLDRKVEGDTRINNIRLHGRQTASTNDGAYPSYISWFVIREYDNLNLVNLDGSELYISHENVEHQTFDYKVYTDDLTSILYPHKSSFGGDPYNLSNNLCSSTSDIWMSDVDATSSDPIYATIYFDRTENLVSNRKFHYDSGHEKFYNASKMSDSDADIHERDHWRGITTSGWAVINFGDDRPIVNVFGIKAVADDLDSCPKSYKFYGGLENYTGPFKLLCEGIFEKTAEWQSITFTNENPYRYYKFEVLNTYGNNIKVQEWQMYSYVGSDKPKYISQLRLHPADFGGLEDNYPKQISLEGSNDTLNWETVLPWTNTYTPYISHNALYGKWQRYSFTNIKGYWHYRLACKDNWGASDGRIIIGEWEMCELAEEANIYRILGGETNDIKQIWVSDNCGFEDEYGLIYVANEKLNVVQRTKLVEEKNISEFYDDVNVI